MSDKEKLSKDYSSDPERTLITLEQLSQTIEVMTSVVDRLRQHLSEQLKSQIEARQLQDSDKALREKELSGKTEDIIMEKKESIVVEIQQQEQTPGRKSSKVLH